MSPIKAGYGEDQVCLSGKLVVVTRYWLFNFEASLSVSFYDHDLDLTDGT